MARHRGVPQFWQRVRIGLVVAALTATLQARSFAGTFTTLDFPGSTSTQPTGMSGDNVIGHYVDGEGEHSFEYSISSGTYTNLDSLLPGIPYGISANLIVGGPSIGGPAPGSAFIYNGTGFTYFDAGSINFAYAGNLNAFLAISGDYALGNAAGNGFDIPFLYNTATGRGVRLPGDGVTGISGNLVVGPGLGPSTYNIATGDTSVPVTQPSGRPLYFYAIDGSIVAGYGYGNAGDGFLCDGTNFTVLTGPNGETLVPQALDGGNVVGYYSDGATQSQEGFLLQGAYTAVPEPGVISLAVMGLAGLLAAKVVRRRRKAS